MQESYFFLVTLIKHVHIFATVSDELLW